MGRPPCCDKPGIKKGPWTPEEDIILVSYIQEHGPGNWRSVPINTGLMRCSKSCRLRWTNYLRPGIKRGNFTPHEEGIIIHLQSLLGNRWAAIASYLPQRTDNDIKNYWNTHLKKKINKYQALAGNFIGSSDSTTTSHGLMASKDSSNETATPLTSTITRSSPFASSFDTSSSSYASSAENISKLLQGFMKSSSTVDAKTTEGNQQQVNSDQESGSHLVAQEGLDALLPFDHYSSIAWDKSTSSDSAFAMSETTMIGADEAKQQPQLSLLEKWLLDEAAGQVDLMELSADCCSGLMF